jgi:hypothetical protein
MASSGLSIVVTPGTIAATFMRTNDVTEKGLEPLGSIAALEGDNDERVSLIVDTKKYAH